MVSQWRWSLDGTGVHGGGGVAPGGVEGYVTAFKRISWSRIYFILQMPDSE
jgi:hypothetical protein